MIPQPREERERSGRKDSGVICEARCVVPLRESARFSKRGYRGLRESSFIYHETLQGARGLRRRGLFVRGRDAFGAPYLRVTPYIHITCTRSAVWRRASGALLRERAFEFEEKSQRARRMPSSIPRNSGIRNPAQHSPTFRVVPPKTLLYLYLPHVLESRRKLLPKLLPLFILLSLACQLANYPHFFLPDYKPFVTSPGNVF